MEKALGARVNVLDATEELYRQPAPAHAVMFLVGCLPDSIWIAGRRLGDANPYTRGR